MNCSAGDPAPIKVGVCGATGRMGVEACRAVDADPQTELVAAIGSSGSVDGLVHSIACASIVAKVCRDRLMARLAARYPGYGWEHNMGYATPLHREAVRRSGLTPHHRTSFGLLQLELPLEEDPVAG